MSTLFPGLWPVLPLFPACDIKVTQPPGTLSPEIQTEASHIWAKACEARPELFNGCVFSADHVSRTCITGHWTEYRLVLAQMKNPSLFSKLKLNPLAVTGLLRTPQGYVLGRRHPSSVYQGNFWQSPPAGSIEKREASDAVNLKEQLLAEAEEELGLPPDSIEVSSPRLIVRHPGTRILDVCLYMTTHLTFDAVETCWKQSGNTEYDQLILLTDQHIAQWAKRPDLLPTSKALLNCRPVL
ncbi:NUDIX hydrolase [Acetobacter thailandicus]|uniref:NUDIX hydrolase n=1 Tax=Acetobacter thailandicus TaxID=1502842 RepID=UPI001BAC05FA|nr:NUDIX hydrolase [Acetobacter thailandicus]MBS0959485.1 NUDIX hydrolase [Acetobacter thailandicus]